MQSQWLLKFCLFLVAILGCAALPLERAVSAENKMKELNVSVTSITEGRARIVGKLGKKVGTVLQLKGYVKLEKGRKISREIMVITHVGSKKLASLLELQIRLIAGYSLPEKAKDANNRLVFIGFERCYFDGIPESLFEHIPAVASEGFSLKSDFCLAACRDVGE